MGTEFFFECIQKLILFRTGRTGASTQSENNYCITFIFNLLMELVDTFLVLFSKKNWQYTVVLPFPYWAHWTPTYRCRWAGVQSSPLCSPTARSQPTIIELKFPCKDITDSNDKLMFLLYLRKINIEKNFLLNIFFTILFIVNKFNI